MTKKAEADKESPPNRRYAGFISYSQKDNAWAVRIHRALEAYRLPIGVPASKTLPKRLGRFFRDNDELSGAPSLGAALEDAIDTSRSLIVICSPYAAQSKWVDAEIRRFKSRGPNAKVFAIIVSGRPDTENSDQQCFPPSLLRKVTIDGTLTDEADEPLAPDASKDSFPRLITRLVAGLIEVDFDTLWQRERRRIVRRRIAVSAVACLIAGASVAGFYAWYKSEQSRLVAESTLFAKEAQTAMDEGRLSDALNNVVSALPENLSRPDRPVTPDAITALVRLMSSNVAQKTIAQFGEPVRSLRQINKQHIAVRLESGSIHVIDATSGKNITKLPVSLTYRWLQSASLVGTVSNKDYFDKKKAFLRSTTFVEVYDLTSGKVVRSLERNNVKWWFEQEISAEGTYALATERLKQQGLVRLGIFKTGTEKVNIVPEPSYSADAAFIEVGQHLRTAFTQENTVLLSWGGKRSGLGIWRFLEEKPRLLIAAGAAPPCKDVAFATDNRRDVTSLSPDRRILSLAQPVNKDDWCVSLWRAATGEPLAPILIQASGSKGYFALTENLVAPSTTSGSYRRNGIRHRDGGELAKGRCQYLSVDFLSLVPLSQTLVVDPEARISICSRDKSIFLFSGVDYTAQNGPIVGHKAKISALALSAETKQIWSGGEDGTVRLWHLDLEKLIEPNLKPVQLVTGNQRTAIMFRKPEGAFVLKVFSADGTEISPRIPFNLVPIEKGDNHRRVKIRLLAKGAILLVSEGFRCGFRGCPPSYKNRFTLIRVSDGAVIKVVDDVARGIFSSSEPLVFLLAPDMTTASLRMKNGRALVLNVVTGETLLEFDPPQGERLADVAYAHGTWWFLSDDQPDDPYARKIHLLRLNAEGKLEKVSRNRAQYGNLQASPGGEVLLVQYNLLHNLKKPVAMIIQPAAGEAIPVELPAKYNKASAETILFPSATANNTQPVALFFGKSNGLAPLVLNIESGEVKPLGTTQSVYASDTWRLDDPLGRAFVSVEDSRLTILPYNSETPLCPELNGISAGAGSFSPDGQYLAIASDTVTVFNLEICQPMRKISTQSAFRSVHFGGNKHLWALDSDNVLHIKDLSFDAAQLLRKARAQFQNSKKQAR